MSQEYKYKYPAQRDDDDDDDNNNNNKYNKRTYGVRVLFSCGLDIKDKYHNGIIGWTVQIVLCKSLVISVVTTKR